MPHPPTSDVKQAPGHRSVPATDPGREGCGGTFPERPLGPCKSSHGREHAGSLLPTELCSWMLKFGFRVMYLKGRSVLTSGHSVPVNLPRAAAPAPGSHRLGRGAPCSSGPSSALRKAGCWGSALPLCFFGAQFKAVARAPVGLGAGLCRLAGGRGLPGAGLGQLPVETHNRGGTEGPGSSQVRQHTQTLCLGSWRVS